MAHAQFGQIRKLLDTNDGVVERRLERLGHRVGQDHGDHHGQDVGDLTGQFEHNDRRGHGVGDGPRQSCSTWGGAKIIPSRHMGANFKSHRKVGRENYSRTIPLLERRKISHVKALYPLQHSRRELWDTRCHQRVCHQETWPP